MIIFSWNCLLYFKIRGGRIIVFIYKSEGFTKGYIPFGISKTSWEGEGSCELHRHEFIEMVYVSDGTSTQRVDGIPYKVESGEVLLIGYNQTHSFSSNEKFHYCNFFVKPQYLSDQLVGAQTVYDIFSFFILDKYFDDEAKRPPVIKLSPSGKIEMEKLISKMERESRERQPGFELALDGYMKLVFSLIIRTFRENDPNNIVSAITPDVLKYIDDNYRENLTLTTLANKCFYNPAYLGRLFKTTFNKSLKEYICEKRIGHAIRLLLETDDTAESIARQVGYDDKKRFYSIFKEKTGYTPIGYREEFKK